MTPAGSSLRDIETYLALGQSIRTELELLHDRLAGHPARAEHSLEKVLDSPSVHALLDNITAFDEHLLRLDGADVEDLLSQPYINTAYRYLIDLVELPQTIHTCRAYQIPLSLALENYHLDKAICVVRGILEFFCKTRNLDPARYLR